MEKLIKENIIYILLAIAVLFAGVYFLYNNGMTVYQTYGELSAKKADLQTKKDKVEQIERQKEQDKASLQEKAQSGKTIYPVPSNQFSSEASFGIMFENILANVTQSGIRIRSIDYNYKPTEDKILAANIPGYNACELSFTAAGSYVELQNFFKNLVKEKYLSSIYEVYIEPYDQDKTILIAKFKIRIYTKSV